MTESIGQKLFNAIFRREERKFESKIGYKLVFRNISDRFINGLVEWDMTRTFKEFGLDIVEGMNYWTMGHVVNGVSSRFDRNAAEYQAWVGAYIVKLASKQAWTVEDHFKLAIADQNSWLHTYGDPRPMTSIEGWEFVSVGPIVCGKYTGTLYEGGCTSHSDVGNHSRPMKFRLETDGMADLFNLSNPDLNIRGEMLRPRAPDYNYETLKLRGYIGIIDMEDTVKVVLYANGAVVNTAKGDVDTFEIIKNDLLTSLQSCEITKM